MRRFFGIIFGILAIAFSEARPVRALDLVGLPGSTWGDVTHDVEGLAGTGTMGYVNQGIDWTVLPGGITVNTFAEFRFRLRSRNKDFYNAYGPALGLELKRSPFKLGVDYYWQRFPGLSQSSDKVQYYLSWYYDWDLMPKGNPILGLVGFPGSTWGQITHDVDTLVGTGSIAYFNQGIDWTVLPGGITVNTFAEFRYRLRSRNKDFYNAYGPALGLELKKSPFKLGVSYFWQRFPGISASSNTVEFYLSWYYDWDLMMKGLGH